MNVLQESKRERVFFLKTELERERIRFFSPFFLESSVHWSLHLMNIHKYIVNTYR